MSAVQSDMFWIVHWLYKQHSQCNAIKEVVAEIKWKEKQVSNWEQIEWHAKGRGSQICQSVDWIYGLYNNWIGWLTLLFQLKPNWIWSVWIRSIQIEPFWRRIFLLQTCVKIFVFSIFFPLCLRFIFTPLFIGRFDFWMLSAYQVVFYITLDWFD